MKKTTKLVFLAALSAISIFQTGCRRIEMTEQFTETLFEERFMANYDPSKSIVKEKSYKDSSQHYSINLSYPQLEGAKFAIANREIGKLINFMLEECNSAAEYRKEDIELMPDDEPYPFSKPELSTFYAVCREDAQLISLYVEVDFYNGQGAHGITERVPYNIDSKTGKVLLLSDMFKSGYDYATPINAFINKKMEENPRDYFAADTGTVSDDNPMQVYRNFDAVSDETTFVVDSSYMYVIFRLYEIAPYATGIPVFEIPLSEFGNNFLY